MDTAEDISSQVFLVHEKKKLCSCKVFALIPVGDSMAGKTSFVKYETQRFLYIDIVIVWLQSLISSFPLGLLVICRIRLFN